MITISNVMFCFVLQEKNEKSINEKYNKKNTIKKYNEKYDAKIK